MSRPTLFLLAALLSGTLPAASAQSGPTVTGLTLIDADTDRPVPGFDPIPGGATLDLARLPPRLNVRANTTGQIGSVRLTLGGRAAVENGAPYALCGNAGSDYAACPANVFTPGRVALSAAPFAAQNAGGASGNGVLLEVTVVRGAAPPAAAPTRTAPTVTSLTLIDADTNRPVAGFDPIPAGAVLRRSALPRNLNLRANVANVGSVRFVVDGAQTALENEAPFAMCVDTRFAGGQKGDYLPCAANLFAPGQHRLVASPFAEMFGRGAAGAAFTWSYRVVP